MSTTSGSRNPVEALAEEFLERKRRGEDATPEEYAEKHPELADEILALFPALLMMEDLGGDSVERTGSVLTGGGAIGGVTTGRLGEFRLLREVGRGGMGVVYEAEQESLGRRVALKVLPSGAITDTKQLRRFQREARSAARLHHTNIVPVFGVGQHEGTHFYVMQFIQGQGLDAVLDELRGLRDVRIGKPEPAAPTGMTHRQRSAADIALSLATGRFAAGAGNGDAAPGTATLPWSASELPAGTSSVSDSGLSSSSGSSGITTFTESDRKFAQSVARIGVQVAEALAYAHSQGVLHRDIKPSNLLLDRDGNVWVADFGLAKATGGDDLTHTGDIVGTVRYMAPERFQGTGDARSDIYALGLTLYELLALRPAFEEKDRASLIRQVTQEDPPRLRKLNRHVPPDLETIIHKTISREPGQRYATAQAVVEDLNRFLEGRPILARRVSAAEQAWRWCKRNPWLAGALGTAASALVAAAVISLVYAAEQSRARRRMSAMASDLQVALEQSNRLSRDLKTSLEVSERRLVALSFERARFNFERGRAASDRGEIGPALLYWVESWRSAVEAGDPALAHAARASLSAWRYQSPRLVRLFPHTDKGTVQNVVLSPNGKTVATVGNDKMVRFWDAATGNPIGSPLMHPDRYLALEFSPDGKTVLTSEPTGARLWDTTSGKPIGQPLTHQSSVYAMAFSPDGKTVLTGSDDNTARLWDATSGKPIGPPLTHQSYLDSLAFSPDGKTVLTGSHDKTARLWNAATGQPIGSPMTHQGFVWAVAFSPDGKTALTGSYDKTARFWDAATGNPIGPSLTHQGAVRAVAFSPDGKTVLTGSFDQTARLWDAASGKPIGSSMTHQGRVYAVAYSPDGKTVLTGSFDQTARLWDAASGKPIGSPLTHQGVVVAVAYSPDGKTVLTGAVDGVRIWDASSDRPIGSPITQRERLISAAFSRDGRRILTGSADKSARLWDAATGQPLGPPLQHQGAVMRVVFSLDGRTALCAGGNEARLWDVAELPDDLPLLESWVHVNTGLALDDQGQVKNLGAAAWHEQRDRLASLGGAPEAEPRWRLDPILFGAEPTARAKAWMERKCWAESEAALTEAVAARPLDSTIRLERARFYTSRSQPEKAAEDYARSYALGDRDSKLIDAIVASESLLRRVVAESSGSAGSLWAKHGELMVSQSRWDEAATDFARELELLPEGRNWDTPRSQRAVVLARWDKAYARLLVLRPDNGQLWCVRGRYHGLLGRWDEAAADFARGVPSAPTTSEEWFEHACLRLIVGDYQGYRAVVRELARRAGRTKDAFEAFMLARTAAMTAEPVVEPEQATRWAKFAVASSQVPWFLHTLGLAHYRAGQFADAIRRLEESNAGQWEERGKMLNRLVLAMAHHRLGHAAHSHALLDEVGRWWKGVEDAKTDVAVVFASTDWLPFQLLRREAEAVILYDPIFPADPFAP